jgi:hypothetical protein
MYLVLFESAKLYNKLLHSEKLLAALLIFR